VFEPEAAGVHPEASSASIDVCRSACPRFG
jgi:hypothetical protein